MIYDEMWDKAIVMLKDDSMSPMWFCFLDREENDDGEYMLSGNAELFDPLPRITLAPLGILDKYRELEKRTGVSMKDVGKKDMMDVSVALMAGETEGMPCLDSSFMREIIRHTRPQSYEELLRLIGFACGNVWTDNGEIFFDNHRMSLREIPAYREDLYEMIADRLYKNGIYDTGFAYEVMERSRRGDYARRGAVDPVTLQTLLSLGFDLDYIFLLEKIHYMFPRAHGVAYLKDAIVMTWYRIHYTKEFDEIMIR